MKIAFPFGGAGLCRLGFELAGHECVDFELDPNKHALGKMLGSGNSVLCDATTVDYSEFDAIWASPPCQFHSDNAQLTEFRLKDFNNPDLLKWSLELVERYPNKIIWIENVIPFSTRKEYAEYMASHVRFMTYGNDWQWGTLWNAAQFLEKPIQQRRRMIGGRYIHPKIYREFKYSYRGVCPAITASLFHDYTTGHLASVRRSECLYYGRCLSIREAAHHQGLDDIPDELVRSWFHTPPNFTWVQWRNNLYQAIGNGVPVFMAKAFGDVYACK